MSTTLQATEYKSTLSWINELTGKQLVKHIDDLACIAVMKLARNQLTAEKVKLIGEHVNKFYIAIADNVNQGEMRYHYEQALFIERGWN
jgi:hypothetical protein